jgi:hypothetical protein
MKKRRTQTGTIIPAVVCAACLLITGMENRIAAQGTPKPAGPDIKIVRTVDDCWSFKDTMIHPNRYVLSSAKITPFPPAAIFDIQTGETKVIDVRKLRGMPEPPQATGLDVTKLKLAGGYWRIYSIDITHYDAEKNTAHVCMIKEETKRTVAGNPPCATCRGEAKFVEKYQRYYCFNCRKYVDEKDYLSDMYVLHYASIDLSAGEVIWIVPVAEGSFFTLGADPTGRYFYFYDSVYFYNREKTDGAFNVYRFNTSSRKLDWKYTVNAPVREKDKAPGSYAMKSFASPDYSRLVFWEYDEEYETGSKKGWLQNPPAQAFVVDVAAKSSFSVPIPSTPYASMIDRDNRYLLLGSNQYGTLHRVDLATQKEDITMKGTRGMFQCALSASGKNLFIFTKTGVEVRSWPDLKLIKIIPLSKIFPGVQVLLTSEQMVVTADGRYAVIGILKKGEQGPWYSSDLNGGFYLLQLSE